VTTVNVEDRDITQIEADALIMAANTLGYHGGAIDQAVQRVSGGVFFDQIKWNPELADGQIIYVSATYEHGGQFRDVIFMIDNSQQPLSQLVLAALQTAEHLHLAHVSLPAFRTGRMAGYYERTIEATADALVEGIKDFVASEPTYVQRVTVAVYHNRPLKTYVHNRLLES
jgi:O-acetyl-ADP-ribose deacetylase (regulator of RNase III)